MKTQNELNTIKKEAETLNAKPRELNEAEQVQVSGGDTEITFDSIMQYIDAGNERWAATTFKLAQYYLAPKECYNIRMAFWAKFGYAIDMYVE